jgi:hypothetical protein
VTALEALDRAESRLTAANSEMAELLKGPLEELQRRPNPKEWSRLEHAEHLAMTHQLYQATVPSALARAGSGSPDQPFVPGIVIGQVMKAMAAGRRVPAPGFVTPKEMPGMEAVERLNACHAQLHDWAGQAGGRDLTAKILPFPIAGVKMSLAAFFMLQAEHHEYHLRLMKL